MELNLFGYSFGPAPDWLPPWAIPVLLLHLVLALVLLIPTWVALARARAFGPAALLLFIPIVGLVMICARMISRVLPFAQWSRAWGLLVLVPGLNIFFLWIFAFAPWRRRYVPLEEEEPEDEEAASQRRAPQMTGASKEARLSPPMMTGVDSATILPGAPRKAEEPSSSATMLAGAKPPPLPSAQPASIPPAPPQPAAPPRTMTPSSSMTMLAGQPTPPQPKPPTVPIAEATSPAQPSPGIRGPRTQDVTAPGAAGSAEDEPATGRAAPVAQGERTWRIVGANDIAAQIDLALGETTLREADAGVLVGRSGRAHLVIEHESVSRNHARFALVNGVLYVEDLDSMNGTWLDGRKLEAHRPAPLRPGSVVEIGKVKLRVSAG